MPPILHRAAITSTFETQTHGQERITHTDHQTRHE